MGIQDNIKGNRLAAGNNYRNTVANQNDEN